MKAIKKILNLTSNLLEYIGMIFLVAMTLIVSYQVFSRQILNTSPRWAEEVSLILMIWFGFIGIALGVRKGIHLSIEYFVSLLPPSLQKIIIKLDQVLVCGFGLFCAVYGAKLVKATGGSTLPATQWPASTSYLMVPVCGVMIICYSLAQIFGIEETTEENNELTSKEGVEL
ncbi:TRAP-type C4-dicarboxylate transport system, small permease component [Anaerovirgula multivorans]|uniref:TRAP-type C4-dicarboxylate transport system, small permease component n=1 Tax=Anaerovirgula multivorans TaxID=312168 RepID=A0A239AMX8_9FIRM|nr:TRAP transporter small permease [Anaerovirgula multivorans]SNR96721.1 TRAP-type C4-dicarboxylate transport system, small permease component [Anaerovirgula multivorans]